MISKEKLERELHIGVSRKGLDVPVFDGVTEKQKDIFFEMLCDTEDELYPMALNQAREDFNRSMYENFVGKSYEALNMLGMKLVQTEESKEPEAHVNYVSSILKKTREKTKKEKEKEYTGFKTKTL